MNNSLQSAIYHCQYEINSAQRIVEHCQVLPELEPLRQWLNDFYTTMQAELTKLLYYLQHADGELLTAISSELAKLQRGYRAVNVHYLPAVHRSRQSDRLSLTILNWLHSQHPQTTGCPVLIADQDFAIMPIVGNPIRYSLPVTYQESLLNVPLFFHELGHYLYEYHREELDMLVKEFQAKLDDFLFIPFQQNDSRTASLKQANSVIIETWYEWIQELYCDAVGLQIGGISYLNAFSYYLKANGRSMFHVSEKDLARRSHPVTWLRVKLMVHRCQALGLADSGSSIVDEWNQLAKIAKAKEDYFGYYNIAYQDDILQTLEDMLTETAPIQFQDYIFEDENIIAVCHQAWEQYLHQPITYPAWEASTIQQLMGRLVITGTSSINS
jgi:hypothetical protein